MEKSFQYTKARCLIHCLNLNSFAFTSEYSQLEMSYPNAYLFLCLLIHHYTIITKTMSFDSRFLLPFSTICGNFCNCMKIYSKFICLAISIISLCHIPLSLVQQQQSTAIAMAKNKWFKK